MQAGRLGYCDVAGRYAERRLIKILEGNSIKKLPSKEAVLKTLWYYKGKKIIGLYWKSSQNLCGLKILTT
jgi:hypothetical protein